MCFYVHWICMENISIIYFLGIQFCFNNFLTKKFKYKGDCIYFVFTIGNDLFNIINSLYCLLIRNFII